MTLLTDPAAIAGLVTREVRAGTRDGAPTKIAVARRSYPTDRADLWDAVTSIERIPRWFLPISGELRVGGRYRLEGNAHGVVEQCDAPERFAVTWEMDDRVSWLTIELTATADGTRLELAHEAPVDPEFWTRYGPGAVGVGWDLALMGLGLYLASGAPVDQAEAMRFPATSEGAMFIRTAALAWADAATDDGDDPNDAQAAAARTIDFYTAVPEDGSNS